VEHSHSTGAQLTWWTRRGVEVLVRRLKLLVRNTSHDPPPDKQLVCGKLVLRPTVSRAYWGETDMRLTVGEYDIVQLLASNAGEHVSYRSIYDCMHYEGFIAGAGDNLVGSGIEGSRRRPKAPRSNLVGSTAKRVHFASSNSVWRANATSMRMRRS
jgi:hypothetical protein